jgi:hypothetical protein
MPTNRLFCFILFSSLIFFTGGCSQKSVETFNGVTHMAMYAIVFIPVSIITSPIILGEYLKGKNNSKISIVKNSKSVAVKVKVGEPMENVFRLLGNPNSKYLCTNPKYEIWEYDKIEKNRYTYMVFNDKDKIDFFSNTWIVSDTCKTLNM